MGIPEEDRGPAWLRDCQYIEADIQAMDDFAKKLRAEVETNYASHLTPIYEDMRTPLPEVSGAYPELHGLLVRHQEATQTTTNQVHDYANRSAGMADAAAKISANYGESDAFAQASVSTVNRALGNSGATLPAGEQPSTGNGTDGATTNPTEGY